MLCVLLRAYQIKRLCVFRELIGWRRGHGGHGAHGATEPRAQGAAAGYKVGFCGYRGYRGYIAYIGCPKTGHKVHLRAPGGHKVRFWPAPPA